MTDILDQIKAIEKEIRETPYHKGTEHHIGMLRARLSKLKEKELTSEKISKGGGGGGYSVKKQGDATIVLIGPPSVGKSTLLNKLTNANSKIAPYAFTTVSVIPGMMFYKDAYIQILDVPGLIEGAEEGKGRGREVLSVARGADLLVLMTDVSRIKSLENINNALERNGIRLNKSKPKVHIDKKLSGGLNIMSNIAQELDKQTIKDVASEFGVKNADISIKEKLNMDTLIDAFARNRVYLPKIEIVNKSDVQIQRRNKSYLFVSAERGLALDSLRELIWTMLELVRVYLVKPDEEPSTKNPFVVKRTYTLADVLERLGSDFSENKKKAVIWGPGSKFPSQEVSLSAKVSEGMQIRFI